MEKYWMTGVGDDERENTNKQTNKQTKKNTNI